MSYCSVWAEVVFCDFPKTEMFTQILLYLLKKDSYCCYICNPANTGGQLLHIDYTLSTTPCDTPEYCRQSCT